MLKMKLGALLGFAARLGRRKWQGEAVLGGAAGQAGDPFGHRSPA